MKLKIAKQICLNINNPTITDKDKLKAVETVLNSFNPERCLSKPILVKVMRYLLEQDQK